MPKYPTYNIHKYVFFEVRALFGPLSPYFGSFEITLRHTALGRAPLD